MNLTLITIRLSLFTVKLVPFICFVNSAFSADTASASIGLSGVERPFVISHRGSSNLYPENTIEAYRAALADGNSFVEADCFLLADGSIGVMHDATLDRTTTSSGTTALQTKQTWQQLKIDGRRLAGAKYGLLRAPLLEELLEEFGNKHILVLEAKNPGSGEAIVRLLKARRIQPEFVVINSFLMEELRAGVEAGYTCCFNERDIVKYAVPPATLIEKGVRWVAIHKEVTPSYFEAAKQVGLNVLIYTVNRRHEWEMFIKMGAVGCYTDDPQYLLRLNHEKTGDDFSRDEWQSGEISGAENYRGERDSAARRLILRRHSEFFRSILLGWMPAMPTGAASGISVYEFSVQIGDGASGVNWVELILTPDDRPAGPKHHPGKLDGDGLEFLLRNTGEIEIIENRGGVSRSLGKVRAAADFRGLSGDYTIVFSHGTVGFGKKTGAVRAVGAFAVEGLKYLTLGAKGTEVQFSAIRTYKLN